MIDACASNWKALLFQRYAVDGVDEMMQLIKAQDPATTLLVLHGLLVNIDLWLQKNQSRLARTAETQLDLGSEYNCRRRSLKYQQDDDDEEVASMGVSKKP